MSSLVPPAGNEGPRQRRVGELRYDIKDAALRQLAAGGVAGISTTAITSELGIAASRIRYHFRTKDDLVDALVVDGFTTLGRELRRVLHDAQHRTTEERWTAFAGAHRDWAVRHAHHYLLMYSAPAPEGPACVVEVFADLVRGCLDGESHGSARTVGLTVHARLHGVVALALVAGALRDVDHDEVFALEVADLGRLLEAGPVP